MVEPWTFSGEPAGGGDAPGTVTLLDGSTFCISAENGDIESGKVHGLFVRDTRVLSDLRLLIDGRQPQGLTSVQVTPFSTKFVSRYRARSDETEASVVVVRTRAVGDGMREELMVMNLSAEELYCTLTLELGADFADIFEVKEERVRLRGFHSAEVADNTVVFTSKDDLKTRSISITVPEGADAGPGYITISLQVAPKRHWTTCLQFQVIAAGQQVELQHPCGEPVATSPAAERLQEWRWQTPRVELAPEAIALALRRSEEDLGSLRMFEPGQPDEPIIAAGAPWFMALFGRDALITSYMTLPVDPLIATGTLRKLARHQGTRLDRQTDEQPGRILHELRSRLGAGANGFADVASFGSIDSTPLFVMLVAEARRWGVDKKIIEELLPHVDRALQWIHDYGDRDGDGFVEYERMSDKGLVNQGWKDSVNGINFASGMTARAPIALCEVQGYVYGAYLARKELALEFGDELTAKRYEELASELKVAFNERFYLKDRGYFAIGLDRDKQPIDALASNMGHALWSGIVSDELAAGVAEKLLSPELFSGFGIRTLATSMGAYNPMGYHNGTVWPHDNAICAAGLMAYGFVEEAQRVVTGMLQAARAFSGRLPECFCGFSKQELPQPVAYPTSCSPQAWASATPYSMIRTLLRLHPDLPKGVVHYSPVLPDNYGALRLGNIPLGGERLTIEVGEEKRLLEGLSSSTALVTEQSPRQSR